MQVRRRTTYEMLGPRERIAAMTKGAAALQRWIDQAIEVCGPAFVISSLENTLRGLKSRYDVKH